MKKNTRLLALEYQTPQVEVIEVEVEKGFAISGNTENPDETEVTPW